MLQFDEWFIINATGSHTHLKHYSKPGKVIVPHPKKDLFNPLILSAYFQFICYKQSQQNYDGYLVM